MTDHDAQLAFLRQQHAATDDPVARTMFAQLIAQLLANRPTQAISSSQVGAAIAGSNYGIVNVTLIFQQAGINLATEQATLLQAYLERLAERCDKLRVAGAVRRESGSQRRSTLQLSQVYVTLASRAVVHLAKADDEEAFAEQLATGDPDTVLPQDARTLGRPDQALARFEHGTLGNELAPPVVLVRPLLLAEALCQRRKLVVLGGPGSDKSSFLSHLAVALARGQASSIPGWQAGDLLPIYVSLGGFAAWAHSHGHTLNTDALWKYMLTDSERHGLVGVAAPILKAFHTGRVLLLLDGLDEVADLADRAATAQAVAELPTGRSYVAVACRERSLVGAVATALAGWGAPEVVAPLSLGQIKHVVECWYGQGVAQHHLAEQEATARVAELTERIAEDDTLHSLAQTPLLLTIIIILHYYQGKLPQDRADLYEDMVQLLFSRWTQQRREGSAPSLVQQLKADGRLGGLQEANIRNLLEKLAYQAHQAERSPDGRGLLPRAIVRQALADLFRQFDLDEGMAANKASQTLTYLEDESGLLLHEGGDSYALPHLTYEEYLAGCYLTKQKGRSDFRTLAYGTWQTDASRWREVIFLALTRMVRGDDRDLAAEWLHFLLEPAHGQRQRANAERQAAALFATECLAEIGGRPALYDTTKHDIDSLLRRLALQLAEVVEGSALPTSERLRAGVLLGELGDPRPGVCNFDPRAFGVFEATSFVVGNTTAEYKAILAVERTNNDEERAKTWYAGSINKHGTATPLTRFELARYLVTNAQFGQFIAAGGYQASAPWWAQVPGGRAWLKRTQPDAPRYWDNANYGAGRLNQPVVGISWYEAMAFCAWLTQHLGDDYTYRLPTEAEWEYAARGVERRVYPWGNQPPDYERANYNNVAAGPSAVGGFAAGATPEKLYDLAGNVWEWTGSVYAPYPYKPDDGREQFGQAAEKHFTQRGGGWGSDPIVLRASYRDVDPPDDHFSLLGFRLARQR